MMCPLFLDLLPKTEKKNWKRKTTAHSFWKWLHESNKLRGNKPRFYLYLYKCPQTMRTWSWSPSVMAEAHGTARRTCGSPCVWLAGHQLCVCVCVCVLSPVKHTTETDLAQVFFFSPTPTCRPDIMKCLFCRTCPVCFILLCFVF